MWLGLGLAWGPVQGSRWLPEGLGAQAPASCLCLGLLGFLCGKKGIARNNTWFTVPSAVGESLEEEAPPAPKMAQGQSQVTVSSSVKWGYKYSLGGDHVETQYSRGEPPGKGLSLPTPQFSSL